jgi:2-hydroxychromene-2-carboxylate isomerase
MQDEDITEDPGLCAAGVEAGFSHSQLEDMLELIKTDRVKEKLKQRTQEALDLGVSC